MEQEYLVDILIPYAKRGGPENIINLLAELPPKTPIRFRVVQYVYGGENWIDSRLEFYPIYPEGLDQNTETFFNGYRNFLLEHSLPNLILATAWPFMSYIAKQVTQHLGIHCPIISWLHASLVENAQNGFGDIKAIAYADAHLAINHKIEQELRDGIPDAKVFYVYNPIDDRKIKVCDTSPGKKAIYVGRLEPIKGVDLAIAAIATTTTSWALDIYGAGTQENMLKQLVKELKLEKRIRFMGWCANPWENVTDAQYILLPSRYESLSLAGLEALANGIPVIATDCDGFHEFLRPGTNGFMVPQEDFAKIADLLDATAMGLLQRPKSDICQESIAPYLMMNALEDFCNKLISLMDGRQS